MTELQELQKNLQDLEDLQGRLALTLKEICYLMKV